MTRCPTPPSAHLLHTSRLIIIVSPSSWRAMARGSRLEHKAGPRTGANQGTQAGSASVLCEVVCKEDPLVAPVGRCSCGDISLLAT